MLSAKSQEPSPKRSTRIAAVWAPVRQISHSTPLQKLQGTPQNFGVDPLKGQLPRGFLNTYIAHFTSATLFWNLHDLLSPVWCCSRCETECELSDSTICHGMHRPEIGADMHSHSCNSCALLSGSYELTCPMPNSLEQAPHSGANGRVPPTWPRLPVTHTADMGDGSRSAGCTSAHLLAPPGLPALPAAPSCTRGPSDCPSRCPLRPPTTGTAAPGTSSVCMSVGHVGPLDSADRWERRPNATNT